MAGVTVPLSPQVWRGTAPRLLLDFLKKVAERYLQDQRAAEFVLDLLQLSVPKLFAVESSGREKAAAASISAEFVAFLKDYITRNSLKLLILSQMKDILVCLIAGVHEQLKVVKDHPGLVVCHTTSPLC